MHALHITQDQFHPFVQSVPFIREMSNSVHTLGETLSTDGSFAARYLDHAGSEYYRNIGQSAAHTSMRSKLAPLAEYVGPNPRLVLSIGVGDGGELQALKELFPNAEIAGLDISSNALRHAQEQVRGWEPALIQGDATAIPMQDAMVDGIVISALLHEVYSYSPRGKEAWKAAVSEAVRVLTANGVLLIRDFAAPVRVWQQVRVTFTTDTAAEFYQFYRANYRMFQGWGTDDMERHFDGSAYPALPKGWWSVEMPMEAAAEMLLHFANFLKDIEGNSQFTLTYEWKETNEQYLMPDPDRPGNLIMSPERYKTRVLATANTALTGTPYEVESVQAVVAERPEAADVLAQHVRIEGGELSDVVRKMEYVFQKKLPC